MPLQICLSRLACFSFNQDLAVEQENLPPESPEIDFTIAMWRAELQNAGHRAWIVAPTARRRRVLQQPMPGGSEGARLLPRLLSLAELATHLTGFCQNQCRLISSAEQSLRMARALQDTGHHSSIGMVGHALKAWSQLHTQQAPGEEFSDQEGDITPRLRVRPLHATLTRFRDALENEKSWDNHLATENLIAELDNFLSPVSRWVERTVPVILLDGFHHLDQQALRLIEKLAERTEVRWWIPATKGQWWHTDVERLLQRLLLPTGRTIHDKTIPSIPLIEVAEQIAGDKTKPSDSFDLGHDPNIFDFSKEEQTGQADHEIAVQDHVPANELKAGTLRLVLVAQRRDESLWVTGEIRKLLHENEHLCKNPHLIAIVVPNSAEATRYRLACQRAGIPCSAQAETIPLAKSRIARLIQVALAAQDGTFSHEELHTLLGSSLFARNLDLPWLLPQLRRLGLGLRKSRTPEGWLQFWTGAIKSTCQPQEGETQEPSELERLIKRAETLNTLAKSAANCMEKLVQVFAGVHPDKEPGSTLVMRLANFMAGLQLEKNLGGRNKPKDLPERELEEDQLAWNNLLDILEGIASTPRNEFPTFSDRFDLIGALNLALGAEQFRLRAQDTACVQIISPEALRGGDFHTQIWVNFRQDAFPPRARGEDHLDPSEPGRIDREARLFLYQGLLATSQAIFVRPGQEGEERLQASPFWNELQKISQVEEEKVLSINPGEEDGLWQGLGHWQDLACLPEKTDILSWVGNQPTIDPHVKGGIANQPALEDWAKTLMKTIWHVGRGFSPTALERFAGCPFRFLVEHTLGLKEDDENRIGMHWGNLVHQAIQNTLSPDASFPTDWESLTAQLREKFNNFEEFLDDFHKHQAERMALQAGTGIRIDHLHGYTVLAAEKEFKTEIANQDLGQIVVQGRIDLVLKRTAPNFPDRVVVDHKTGKMSGIKEKVEAGRLLQPSLYGWALQKGERKPDLKVEAAYLLLRHDQVELKGSAGLPNKEGKPIDGRTRPFSMKLETIEETVVNHVGEIRGGKIGLTPFGPNTDKPECTYCPLKNSCRHPLNG